VTAESARPTLRCLREDLELALPPVNRPLDEIDHPLIRKAAERFADPDTPHERIRAIDDQVLFKVKVQRWRGAVWVEADLPWLVAGGRREDGSPDDFYAALESSATAARARYNDEHAPPLTTSTYTGHLLPGREDDLRFRAEDAARAERRLRPIVHDLVRASLLDGHEHAVMLDGACGCRKLVRAGHGGVGRWACGSRARPWMISACVFEVRVLTRCPGPGVVAVVPALCVVERGGNPASSASDRRSAATVHGSAAAVLGRPGFVRGSAVGDPSGGPWQTASDRHAWDDPGMASRSRPPALGGEVRA
jgi:hypothetical protein